MTACKVSTLGGIIDDMLGDIHYDPAEFGQSFMTRVGCVKMAAPRHERFELIREMGMTHIDDVFNATPLPENMTFVFPERWMSVHEQQGFFHKIINSPYVDRIQSVDIITSSPVIISDFSREQIRILTWPDDSLHDGGFNR